MHALVSDLCEMKSNRKFADVIANRTNSNRKYLSALKAEYEQYEAVL